VSGDALSPHPASDPSPITCPPPQDLESSNSGSIDVDAERLQKMLEVASDINDRRTDFLQLYMR